jgi:metal-dependent amidase/aminoacylase/carboxypeptidase family protein
MKKLIQNPPSHLYTHSRKNKKYEDHQSDLTVPEEMTNWRRDIHAHPEIAFDEHRTAKSLGKNSKALA